MRHGNALHAAGRRDEAQRCSPRPKRQRERQPNYPLLYSLQGYHYCDLLLGRGEWTEVRERATQTPEISKATSVACSISHWISLALAAPNWASR